MNILLVQPRYYTRYPPLGLLKLSSYHRQIGDSVELARDLRYPEASPDLIYVTSLFTYAWEPVYKAIKFYQSILPRARIILGGIYATLMPEHAKLSGAEIHSGLFKGADGLLPDYSLVDSNVSVGFTSRGCGRGCPFCAVSVLEPFKPKDYCWKSLEHVVYPGHGRVVLWDNNFLASPSWRDIVSELRERQLSVDFNQGLDCRLMNERVVNDLKGLRLERVRLAYDTGEHREPLRKAIDLLDRGGFVKRNIIVYAMFNYSESPEEFLNRLKDLMEWGVVAYPMRYEPINAFDEEGNPLRKNVYVSPKWTAERLEMVARARRVIGYGGAFPPYKGLKKKFASATDFDEAFELRPPGNERGTSYNESASFLGSLV